MSKYVCLHVCFYIMPFSVSLFVSIYCYKYNNFCLFFIQVATQCLETAYAINTRDDRVLRPDRSLVEIFTTVYGLQVCNGWELLYLGARVWVTAQNQVWAINVQIMSVPFLFVSKNVCTGLSSDQFMEPDVASPSAPDVCSTAAAGMSQPSEEEKRKAEESKTEGTLPPSPSLPLQSPPIPPLQIQSPTFVGMRALYGLCI